MSWVEPHALDRSEELRDDVEWVRTAWERSRVLGVDPDGRLTASADGLVWLRPEGAYDEQRHFLLGVDGDPVFATEVERAPAVLRDVMDAFGAPEVQIAFTAAGLVGWHRRSGFCPTCGAPTVAVSAGQARRCTGCGVDLYPRTDPAVIVAILDASGRLLLGRQPSWPTNRRSVFAGFVETGESLEQAVHREIGEEVGLTLTRLAYLGSQPWPFPRSLMVGFVAFAEGTQLRPAAGEIEDAAWFTVDELRAATATGDVALPMTTSIAHRMITAWLEGRLPLP